MNMTAALSVTAAIAAIVICTDATATAQRTFVASYGSDANACSRALPCRSFGAAITQTSPNGEIIVIDSAGYGSVTVTKSVSIIAPAGIYAGISVGGGANGVTVNSAGVHVRLRGLAINGTSGSSGSGVEVVQAASVGIEDCTITNLGQYGIESDAATDVTVERTTVHGNQAGGIVQMGAGRLTVTGSRITGNANTGVQAYAGKVTIVHSLIAANAVHGVEVDGTSGSVWLAISASTVTGHSGGSGIGVAATSPAYADIANNTIAGSGNGIVVGGSKADIAGNQVVYNVLRGVYAVGAGALARVTGNGVFGNATGFDPVGGATVNTPGDNYVRDNGTNATGSTPDSLL